MMNNIPKTNISVFDKFKVRKVWNKDERYFPINDIVFVLTESKNVVDYIKKLKNRNLELSKGWGQIVTPLLVDTKGGPQKLNCTNTKGALRIIQSIPSSKAEPFKQWLASIGNERIDEINNPELGIQRAKQRAIEVRRKQGHDEKRISKRIQSIDTRNSFTDMLKEKGIKAGFEYALITNKIYSIGLGVKGGSKEYKNIKGLRKNDNLRDHMDGLEIALVDLAEAGSQKIIDEKNGKGFEQIQTAVEFGSDIAGKARQGIEKEIGKSVVTGKNYFTDEQKLDIQ